MAEIDFSRIRATPKSRTESFEGLAAQLFRCCCPTPAGSTFYRLRGEGGDGGVEAYFQTPQGEVFGVQAKYFFKLGASELGQISDSLKTALSVHPGLTGYWVYLPFDLTGRTARKGKSEVERFEEWKEASENAARANGRPITLQLVSASEIRDQLHRVDTHGGIRRYWFDDALLTRDQIESCLQQAIAFAGPRYTEGLDVVTNAHQTLDFFGGIGDFAEWRETVLKPLLAPSRFLVERSGETFGLLSPEERDRATRLLAQAISRARSIRDAMNVAQSVPAIRADLAELRPLALQARDLQEKDFVAKHGPDADTPGFRQYHAEYMCTFPAGPMDAARDSEKLVTALDEVLLSPLVQATSNQSLLLVGPAGVGKTHALVSAAIRRLEKGAYSLVVFGDDFGRAEPWEVLRSKLGLGSDVGRETLLECLQACAENTGLPFLIAIDALNENSRKARWKDKLPELLAQCKPYGAIRVCVSTRDTYRDLVVDSRFPGFAFQHAGFKGHEFQALEAFSSFYGLDAEITPLFADELSNPLFLHLACRVLKEQGAKCLDVLLPGFSSLFESHLSSCDTSVRSRLGYSNPTNVVREAMLALAQNLASAESETRTWTKCVETLRPIVGSELSPETLLGELEHEGLVILTRDESGQGIVRIGYQRYGDVLRAIGLIESVTDRSSGRADLSRMGELLPRFGSDDEGLLEALAAVLPERTGVEITEPSLQLDSERANRLFVASLPWRSRQSIPEDIRPHLSAALKIRGLWQDVYEVLFKLCLVPNHRLNACECLHALLSRQDLCSRDYYLSLATFKSYDAEGAVKSLLEASLHSNIARWPTESRRLAGCALGWLTSCADRRVRDQATKALARVLGYCPEIAEELARSFEDCGDDYILESVVAAIYSACLLDTGSLSKYVPALDALLSPGYDTPNVLVRDTVRLLAGRLVNAGIPAPLSGRLAHYPTRAAAPNPWPAKQDAEKLRSLEHLPVNMDLLTERLRPDFWRYKIEGRVDSFDLKAVGVAHENIAAWVMVETLKLGYPGRQNLALKYDRIINYEYGQGRGRKGYAERLGKKYYWISFHRLLGVLSDNVPLLKGHWRERRAGHYWSAEVRKADPTDVRDLFPEKKYPDEVLTGPRYTFPPKEGDVKDWARTDDFTSHGLCLVRTASDGTEWVALSLGAQDRDKDEDDEAWAAHRSADVFYTSVFTSTKVPRDLVSRLKSFSESQGAHYYRAYLAEYPDGRIFQQCIDEQETYMGSDALRVTEVSLLRGGEWEYDYSSTPAQENLRVPCRELVRRLKLTWDRQRGWCEQSGNLASFEGKAKMRWGLFLRRDLLNQFLIVTNSKLFFRCFRSKGFHISTGGDGCVVDINTYLRYERSGAPVVVYQKPNPFNC